MARTCHLSFTRQSGTRNFLPSAILQIRVETALLDNKRDISSKHCHPASFSMGSFAERNKDRARIPRQLGSLVHVATLSKTFHRCQVVSVASCNAGSLPSEKSVYPFLCGKNTRSLSGAPVVEGQQEPHCIVFQAHALVVETCRSRTVLIYMVHRIQACPTLQTTRQTHRLESRRTHMLQKNTKRCLATTRPAAAVLRSGVFFPAAAVLSSAC